MKTVIVNADDFGYSDGICRSICELLDEGAVSSTTVMTAAHDAANRLRRWNAKDLRGLAGVHLQLTGGAPLSPPSEVPSLVDHSSGTFRNPRSGTVPHLDEVEVEWRRQIEAASDWLGGPPTHLDSHHGVHRIPQIFDLYCALGSEYGLPMRGAGGEVAEKIVTNGVRATVAVVREWTGRQLGAEALRCMITETSAAFPEEEYIEVVVHPGYNDAYLASVSSLSIGREADHAVMLELKQLGWPGMDGYLLGSHRALPVRSPGSLG